jgi:hypothetical protein
LRQFYIFSRHFWAEVHLKKVAKQQNQLLFVFLTVLFFFYEEAEHDRNEKHAYQG